MPLTKDETLRLIEHLKETLEPAWVPKVGDRVRMKLADGATYLVVGIDNGDLKLKWGEYLQAGLHNPRNFEPVEPPEDHLAFLDRTGYRVQKYYDGWAVDGPTRLGVITRGHATSRDAIEAAQAKEGK